MPKATPCPPPRAVSLSPTPALLSHRGTTSLSTKSCAIPLWRAPIMSNSANASRNTVFDLSQYRLEGVDFKFNDGVILEPGGYLVVVKNRNAFLAAYPGGAAIAGEYHGDLNPAGQTLRLLAPTDDSGNPTPSGTLVNAVAYGNQSPWPSGDVNSGSSLQFVESFRDNSLPANWQTIAPSQASTPQWQFVSVTGVASTNSNLLVYHSPLQQVPDPMDISGQWEGTISFPGLEYAMTVDFQHASSNQWSGGFYGEDFTTPLTGIKYTNVNIYFVLDNTGGSVWVSGKSCHQRS